MTAIHDMATKHERRSYFRLYYPRPEQPRLLLGDVEYPVLNLSESGAAILEHQTSGGRLDGEFAGILEFLDGERVEVQGVILRRHGNRLAVRFIDPIGMSRMMAEQRRLLKKYPCLRE